MKNAKKSKMVVHTDNICTKYNLCKRKIGYIENFFSSFSHFLKKEVHRIKNLHDIFIMHLVLLISNILSNIWYFEKYLKKIWI